MPKVSPLAFACSLRPHTQLALNNDVQYSSVTGSATAPSVTLQSCILKTFCVSLFYQIIANHLYSIIFMRVIGNPLGAGIPSHIPGEIQHTYHSERMELRS